MDAPRLNGKPHGEAGFATVVMLVICVGLSTLAIAWLGRAQAAAMSGKQEIERETARLAVRSALARTSMDLAAGAIAGRGVHRHTIGGLEVEVTISNEQDKLNILAATPTDLDEALSELPEDMRHEAETIARSAKSLVGSSSPSLGDILTDAEVAGSHHECLRARLTVHVSTIDPLSAQGDRPATLAGAILDIDAVIAGPIARDIGREQIVVATGNRREPVLILVDRPFRPFDLKECVDDA